MRKRIPIPNSLRTLRIGAKALKACEYFVLLGELSCFNSPLDYVNRVHFEEDVGKLQIIPEEYPNLPQEAEIQCLANSFRVEGKRWLCEASSRSVSPSAGDRVRRGVSEERGALRSEL